METEECKNAPQESITIPDDLNTQVSQMSLVEIISPNLEKTKTRKRKQGYYTTGEAFITADGDSSCLKRRHDSTFYDHSELHS